LAAVGRGTIGRNRHLFLISARFHTGESATNRTFKGFPSFESQFQIPEPEDGITAPFMMMKYQPEIEQYLEQLVKISPE
jgi:hypothetical protein